MRIDQLVPPKPKLIASIPGTTLANTSVNEIPFLNVLSRNAKKRTWFWYNNGLGSTPSVVQSRMYDSDITELTDLAGIAYSTAPPPSNNNYTMDVSDNPNGNNSHLLGANVDSVNVTVQMTTAALPAGKLDIYVTEVFD